MTRQVENRRPRRKAAAPDDRLSASLLDPVIFTRSSGVVLRGYQEAVMQAVCRSENERGGHTFVVMFPRQSGKNELQAHIEAYLLQLRRYTGGEIVKISPTWRPQSLNSMRRLARVLDANQWTRGEWSKENGYIFRLGEARILFLSGAPEANIVGATASLLLEIDEAQDVTIPKYDRDILPMAAATNATRVLWGTAWTSRTLLARELESARRFDAAPGHPPYPTAFVLTADDVIREAPGYARHVAGQVQRLGRDHPFVRTQYYSEPVDGQGGLFPPARIARLFPHGAPPGLDLPCLPQTAAPLEPEARPAGGPYAVLIDVGGIASDPGGIAGDPGEPNPPGIPGGMPGRTGQASDPGGKDEPVGASARRDSTALTVVAVDLGGLSDPLRRAPLYRPVLRRVWTGVSHAGLYPELLEISRAWRAARLVIDATGVGAGLASFLEQALPGRVTRFLFTSASKSRLGWDFVSLVDAGRWVEWAPGPLPDPPGQPSRPVPPGSGRSLSHHQAGSAEQDRLRWVFLQQLSLCAYEIQPGPGQVLRWGVPDGTRDPGSGALVHDDLLISAALAGLLDTLDWPPAARPSTPGIVRAKDPLSETRGY